MAYRIAICGLIGWRSGGAVAPSSAPGPAWVPAVRAVVAMWAAPSGPAGLCGRLRRSILDVGVYVAPLHYREREDHHEEHERLGARQAKQRAAKGRVVDVHHRGEGAAQRPTLRALHQV